MSIKMQTISYCFKRLLSPVFKSSVLLKPVGVFRSVCSVPKTCYYSPYSPRPANVSSCQRWHHVNSSNFNTQRFYSEICSESDPKRNAEVLQEESHEKDNDGSSVTFSLDVLVSLLRQENAVDICVIKVPEQLKYAEYFIVVSGISARHLRAMALYAVKVYKFLKKEGESHIKLEGKDAEDWMCIDFGNIVVHFMLPETREKYELEKLWTLRTFDEQLKSIPVETLPEDFIYGVEDTK